MKSLSHTWMNYSIAFGEGRAFQRETYYEARRRERNVLMNNLFSDKIERGSRMATSVNKLDAL